MAVQNPFRDNERALPQVIALDPANPFDPPVLGEGGVIPQQEPG